MTAPLTSYAQLYVMDSDNGDMTVHQPHDANITIKVREATAEDLQRWFQDVITGSETVTMFKLIKKDIGVNAEWIYDLSHNRQMWLASAHVQVKAYGER